MNAKQFIVACALTEALVACGSAAQADWRAQALENAHQSIRIEAGDPNATFVEEKITGEEIGGQVCGHVVAKNDSLLSGSPARYLWFIDGNGGPWVEGGHGPHAIPSDQFDWNWKLCCSSSKGC